MNERLALEREVQAQRSALASTRMSLEARIDRLELEIMEVAGVASADPKGHDRIAVSRERLVGTLRERLASARAELEEIPVRDAALSAQLPPRSKFGLGRRADDREPVEHRQERFERRLSSRMREIEALTAQAVEAAARAALVAASEGSTPGAPDNAPAADRPPEGSVRARALAAGVSARTLGKLDRVAVLRPDLLAQVRAGTLSVHRAACIAGIEKAQTKSSPPNVAIASD